MAERLPVEIEEPCQIFHESLFAIEESVAVLSESSIQDMDVSGLRRRDDSQYFLGDARS